MHAEMYEESADRGDCVHRSPMLCREIEEEMPKAMRLHADPPGRRPRGPSHLTLPSEDFDRRTGEPTGRCIPPSWPAYRDNYARQRIEIPSSIYGSSHDRPSQRGPSHHRTNHHEPSFSRSFSMLPQDFGRSQGEVGVGRRSRMGSMGHSHESHHHGASEYGGSSLGDSDTSSQSRGARSGMGGRRGSGTRHRPGMGGRQDSGTW